MKYPHIVVLDGVWYPAGTEVPVGETKAEEVAPIEVTEVAEEQTIPTVTKKELDKMKASEVKELAVKLGFTDVEDVSAAELRRNIAKMLNL